MIESSDSFSLNLRLKTSPFFLVISAGWIDVESCAHYKHAGFVLVQ